MPPGASTLVGRDKVVARYDEYFKSVLPTFELKPGLIQESGKWAFLSGEFTRAEMVKAGGEKKQVAGHYLFVLKKQPDGGWKIARDIWNEAVKR